MKKWLSIISIFLLFIFIMLGCTARDKLTPRKEAPSTKMKFTNANYSKVLGNANKYKGAIVEITGKVFIEPKRDEDIFQFQIYTDPKQSEGNTIVVGKPEWELKKDDFVKIIGVVEKEQKYESIMGAKMSAPLIMASKIEKLSPMDVLAPTLNIVAVNQTQDQYGVKITIEKLEFAKDETRVYIKLKNESSHNASFYTFNSKATQATTQFETIDSFEADYPKPQSEILPGIETSGVIVFKPLSYEAKSCQIILEARNENYSLDFKPYKFDITW